jgi:hypothetical protein
MYKITVLVQTKQKFSKILKIKIVKKMSRQRSETFHVNPNVKQWDIKEMKENQSVTYLIWIFPLILRKKDLFFMFAFWGVWDFELHSLKWKSSQAYVHEYLFAQCLRLQRDNPRWVYLRMFWCIGEREKEWRNK